MIPRPSLMHHRPGVHVSYHIEAKRTVSCATIPYTTNTIPRTRPFYSESMRCADWDDSERRVGCHAADATGAHNRPTRPRQMGSRDSDVICLYFQVSGPIHCGEGFAIPVRIGCPGGVGKSMPNFAYLMYANRGIA